MTDPMDARGFNSSQRPVIEVDPLGPSTNIKRGRSKTRDQRDSLTSGRTSGLGNLEDEDVPTTIPGDVVSVVAQRVQDHQELEEHMRGSFASIDHQVAERSQSPHHGPGARGAAEGCTEPRRVQTKWWGGSTHKRQQGGPDDAH